MARLTSGRRRESRRDRKPDDHRAFHEGYVEPNRLFVGGVPKVTTEERFRAHFERFGHVIRVELNAVRRLPTSRTDTSQARSFGFVTFQDKLSVDKALEQCVQQDPAARPSLSFPRLSLRRRMHSFNHSGTNVAFIEVRRPLPRKRGPRPG